MSLSIYDTVVSSKPIANNIIQARVSKDDYVIYYYGITPKEYVVLHEDGWFEKYGHTMDEEMFGLLYHFAKEENRLDKLFLNNKMGDVTVLDLIALFTKHKDCEDNKDLLAEVITNSMYQNMLIPVSFGSNFQIFHFEELLKILNIDNDIIRSM